MPYFRASAIFAGLTMVPIASGVDAAPPELRTPAPVIYLADNLDEKDRLGYCIDTLGRGLSDRLQAHSCKPAGGDVQFVHVEASGHIRSATYTNKCAQLLSAPAEGVGVALLDCSDNPLQRFEYDRADQTIRPGGQAGLCLAAGAASRSAGPFMSRDLLLADCAQAEPALIRWEVVGGP